MNPDAAGASRFARASLAYDVLSDPARRAAYDASLDAAAAVFPPARRPTGASRGENAMLAGLAILACVGLLYIVAFALGLRISAPNGAQPTEGPESTAAVVAPSASARRASASPTPALPATGAPAQVTSPGTPAPTALPATASPTLPSPGVTPPPQPSATPPPSAPPSATVTPGAPSPTAAPAGCVVPAVIGLRRNAVQTAWTAAGFSTPVTFLPGSGNYAVATQSPAAGSTGACATTILAVGP